ncbi:ankyrin repeat-containing domain protein [Aspergillus pseudocaelatus]|uniref:Ankyrin repeat-containing domain protein n=1 Tax=Aspergillus pseudocaelatus TaxID=1825620 RepID=A0ABQ6WTX1_9EURO|nr:ankyrin repeat-containing domain protein [Aspergillus pseudocaelatus]
MPLLDLPNELLLLIIESLPSEKDVLSILPWYSEKGYTMLEKGADIESTDLDCFTPLICAASHGHEDVVRLLLEKGADLEAEDDEECTPVIWAARKGYEGVVRLLIEKGADLQHEDDARCTAIANCAMEGHEGVPRLLLETVPDLKYSHVPVILSLFCISSIRYRVWSLSNHICPHHISFQANIKIKTIHPEPHRCIYMGKCPQYTQYVLELVSS